MQIIEFILYVTDQKISADFYKEVLGLKPETDEPGMTEFRLADKVFLGLMPETGIAKIINPKLPHPSKGNGIPRCELYLKVEDANRYYQKALKAGAIEVDPLKKRNWGDRVGYIADPDGHVIAFAE